MYEWAEIKLWSLQYGMNNGHLDRTSKVGNELLITSY
jgi:hypothetical protein